MRGLTKVEVAAMWRYSDEYARSGLGAIEFWKRLPNHKKSLAREMINEIEKCPIFEKVTGTSKMRRSHA
jgi:hypothetical protein